MREVIGAGLRLFLGLQGKAAESREVWARRTAEETSRTTDCFTSFAMTTKRQKADPRPSCHSRKSSAVPGMNAGMTPWEVLLPSRNDKRQILRPMGSRMTAMEKGRFQATLPFPKKLRRFGNVRHGMTNVGKFTFLWVVFAGAFCKLRRGLRRRRMKH